MKYIKRLYFYLKERYTYRQYIKKIGITFPEYSKYVNNIWDKDDKNTTVLFDKNIRRINNICYMECVMEIFIDEVYRFETSNKAPLIIDCGANIGLSVIYFKQLYPNSEIIAFEADPSIAEICRYNVEQFNFNDVDVINAAVWTEDGYMSFLPNDSLGGKLEGGSDLSNSISVRTLRLLPYLERPVDFLKIDIEGAEVDLLLDIKDSLDKVGLLFVEYHSSVGESQRLDLLLRVLTDSGFRYYIKEAYPAMSHPFLNYSNKNKFTQGTFDLQLNIFAYRA